MKLHENIQLFKDAIMAAARPEKEGGIGINRVFIEKDYWICRSLYLMSKGDKNNRAIFKGGTSLTKAYMIGTRFSEDVDVAIAETWMLSGNQLKNFIRRTSKNMTEGLEEIVIPGVTSKGSHYHKAFYKYPQVFNTYLNNVINCGQLLVEINSFANPYPFEKRTLSSFITDFLQANGNNNLIEEYEMQPFSINVLDKRRTLTEKLVSLFRCSLADSYMQQLTSKIRHFYDLHYLLQDEDCHNYLFGKMFFDDFTSLFEHDRQYFDKPLGWQSRKLKESPLLNDLSMIWNYLQSIYIRKLSDLAYRPIPEPSVIENSIQEIFSIFNTANIDL